MKNTSKTLLFFGSGPVAAASLTSLLNNFSFEAVITKQVPLHHKEPAPVEQIARKNGLPVHFASTQKELDRLFEKNNFNNQIALVVDYGVIISKEVIDYFKLGIINSHFSLLPRWRGADPISFAVLNGDHETGVSLMRIVPALDEGRLISQDKLKIDSNIRTPELTIQLIKLSSAMIARDLPRYIAGELLLYDQPKLKPTYSRKLTKQDAWLDLTKSATVLEREIRAFAGWPKSKIKLNGNIIIVIKASVVNNVITECLVLKCADNTFLEIMELIAPSGKKMSGADFKRGYST